MTCSLRDWYQSWGHRDSNRYRHRVVPAQLGTGVGWIGGDPLIAVISRIFQTKMRTIYRNIRVRLSRVNGFLNENITGMVVVQLFNRERPCGRNSIRSTPII
jgi:ABC-type multidrug transport system fused ATPase/permease subunit